MGEVLVATERLDLRRWRDSDLDLWLEHLNTAEVKRHLGGVSPREVVVEKFEKMRRGWDADGFSFLAMERRADGMFLGTCGISRIETPAAPQVLRDGHQVGWQMRREAWGHGYATEGARGMLGHAFGALGWPLVYAQTSSRNRASWRVMERLGMTRREDLDYHDPAYEPEENPTIIWSLAAEEHLRQSGVVHADNG